MLIQRAHGMIYRGILDYMQNKLTKTAGGGLSTRSHLNRLYLYTFRYSKDCKWFFKLTTKIQIIVYISNL